MLKKTSRWIILLIFAILLIGSVMAQSGVRAVVVNEFANIRVAPALGANVITTVSAGYEFTIINGRSGDDEWLRVQFAGNEGWVHTAPLKILEGDMSALPVADPRTIPYGGFEAPRSGPTSALGPMVATVTNGLRMRAGPSTAYPMLANIPANYAVSVTGRTASNTWYQVVFDGILGWVAAQFLTFDAGSIPGNLPVDGIVADSPPASTDTAEDYIGTLKFMLARLNIAQASLDQIRSSWADAALNGRAVCQGYPARPSDMHIATPLLAAFYPTLNPLLNDFNTSMYNVRYAIDLFIEVCNQPGTGNPVGTATVQGALGVVNLADAQFGDIRNRLNALIPPDLEAGEGQCLLIYGQQAELLPAIATNTIYIENITPKDTTKGYCFDAVEGQVLMFQTLQLPGSNIAMFLAVSPFDNPTNFLAVGRTIPEQDALTVSPVLITRTGRYLLIIADTFPEARPAPPQGNFALAILDITNATINPQLTFNPDTGDVTVSVPAGAGGTAGGGTTGEVEPGATQEPGSVVCPSLAFTCNQLFTCAEAQACLAAGNFSLDPDDDGFPCEDTLCTAP